MIKLVITPKKNTIARPASVKYYPQPAPATPLSLEDIVKRVETACTLTSSDIKAALDALQHEIIRALSEGNTVRLGDLGSFRLAIKAEGCDTREEAQRKSSELVKEVKVKYTQSSAMRRAFDKEMLKFQVKK